MNPDDAFDGCLEALYGAALDDAGWAAAAARVEAAVGTGGSSLVVAEEFGDDDRRVHFARFLERGESREDLAREYFGVYHAHDEGMPRLRRSPNGRLVHVPALYTGKERRTSPTYNEMLRRRAASDEGLYARFDGADGLRIVCCFGNPVGGRGWQSDGLRLAERLLPHLHRSVRVRQALAAADALGAGLAGLLDNDRIGVVHLDRHGRVLAANDGALEVLRGGGLRERDGGLHAALPAQDSRLQRLLRRALPGSGDGPPAGGSITIERPQLRSRLALHVHPVDAARADFGARRAAALVLVVDPRRRTPVDPGRVSALLGLTRSEARIAALLAEGRPVRGIAAATGYTEGYVRWLLKQAYRKLGVSGQVALVRQVLAAYALPRS